MLASQLFSLIQMQVSCDDHGGSFTFMTMSKSQIGTIGLFVLMAGIWFVARLFPDLPAKPLALSLGLASALIVLTWFDLDHFRIPNWISLPLIAAGLGLAVFGFVDWRLSVLGAGIGYGLIWALSLYWLKVKKQEGIGLGDAKLLAAAGAWLGAFALPFVLLIASGTALLIIICASVLKGQKLEMTSRIPFGPFISIGFWTMWIAGDLLLTPLPI